MPSSNHTVFVVLTAMRQDADQVPPYQVQAGLFKQADHKGFAKLCACRYNALAQAQSHAPDERLNRHADMLLHTCDQFSRSRLPGYTGYKPQVRHLLLLCC